MSALIDGKILCMHGGISPHLTSFDQINEIKRPTDCPESGLLTDLLWSDPRPGKERWGESERGISYCFNAEVVQEFCEKMNIDWIC